MIVRISIWFAFLFGCCAATTSFASDTSAAVKVDFSVVFEVENFEAPLDLLFRVLVHKPRHPHDELPEIEALILILVKDLEKPLCNNGLLNAQSLAEFIVVDHTVVLINESEGSEMDVEADDLVLVEFGVVLELVQLWLC